ncbi:MAG: hypothetical protein HY421_02180 [Candidatus Kerfeldbacteria bacterium]|nr:hypothetical protein [Candidatus Kerfeldbacteria bacterium]
MKSHKKPQAGNFVEHKKLKQVGRVLRVTNRRCQVEINDRGRARFAAWSLNQCVVVG